MTEKTTQSPKRTRGERQKDSVYSQKHKEKKGAKRFVFELHTTDDDELALIEQLEQAKANGQGLKDVIKQSLINYFQKF